MTITEIPADPTDPAWHEARRSFLGASEAAAVLGIHPFKTPLDIWGVKVGLTHDDPANLASDIGHELEDVIARRWLKQAQQDAVERLWLYEQPRTVRLEGTCLACTPDRRVMHGDEIAGLLECKVVGGNLAHHWADGPPLYVELQARLQAKILRAGWVDVCSLHYRYGWDFNVTRVHHDPAVIDPIVEQLEDWWQRHVVEGEQPELVGDPWKLKEALGYLYKPREDLVAVRLPSDAAALIDDLKRTKALRKDLDADVTRLEAELMAMLGDATDGYLDDNQPPVVTWRAQTRAAYSVEAKTYRTLRIK